MAQHDICKDSCALVKELREQLKVSIDKRTCIRPVDFCNDLIEENRQLKEEFVEGEDCIHAWVLSGKVGWEHCLNCGERGMEKE